MYLAGSAHCGGVCVFPFPLLFSFLHMQQATPLSCEILTIARQHIIKCWNEQGRPVLLEIRGQRVPFGLGKALEGREGLKWALGKIWLDTEGQLRQQ